MEKYSLTTFLHLFTNVSDRFIKHSFSLSIFLKKLLHLLHLLQIAIEKCFFFRDFLFLKEHKIGQTVMTSFMIQI